MEIYEFMRLPRRRVRPPPVQLQRARLLQVLPPPAPLLLGPPLLGPPPLVPLPLEQPPLEPPPPLGQVPLLVLPPPLLLVLPVLLLPPRPLVPVLVPVQPRVRVRPLLA